MKKDNNAIPTTPPNRRPTVWTICPIGDATGSTAVRNVLFTLIGIIVNMAEYINVMLFL